MQKMHGFDLVVKCRHMECEEKFKKIVTDGMFKLCKFNNSIIDGKVMIQKSSVGVEVDISIRVPGLTIVAVNEDYNHLTALDGALGKAKTQVKKLNKKIKKRRIATDKTFTLYDSDVEAV